MFKYYVHNTGKIRGLKVKQLLESGIEVVRKNVKSSDLSFFAYYELPEAEFTEVSREDAGHILHFLDKSITCDSLEEELTRKPYIPEYIV